MNLPWRSGFGVNAAMRLVVFGLMTLLCAASVSGDEDQPTPLPVGGLDYSPQGDWLAVGNGTAELGGSVVLWRVADWTPHVLHTEAQGCPEIAFSPDGKLLAFRTSGPVVGILEVATGKLLQRFEAHSGRVYSVAFTPEGATLVTAAADRTIKLWNVATGELQKTLEGHTNTVYDAAVSPDGRLLLSGGGDGTARLWDLNTGTQRSELRSNEFVVRRAMFSADGRYLLLAHYDGYVRICEAATGQVRAMLRGGGQSADLSRDLQFVASCGWGPTADVFRVALEPPTDEQRQRIDELIRRFESDDYAVREAASRALIELGMVAEPQLREAMQSDSVEVRLRARHAHQQVRSPQPIAHLSGHQADVQFVRFSPDGRLLATGSRDGVVKIWAAPAFTEIKTWPASIATPSSK